MGKFVIVVIATLAITTQVQALTLSGVKLKSLNLDKGAGEAVFISTTVPTTVRGCHTDLNWNFVLPLSTAFDRAVYASLLSALTTGKPVDIEGTNDCAFFATIESVKRVRVWDQLP